MKRKHYILVGMFVITILFAFFVGYIAGYYVEGMTYANEAVVHHRSDQLVIDSGFLLKLKENPTQTDLVETIRQICENKASFIKVNKPAMSMQTRDGIDKALNIWGKAKEKLKSIQSSNVESNS